MARYFLRSGKNSAEAQTESFTQGLEKEYSLGCDSLSYTADATSSEIENLTKAMAQMAGT